MTLTSTTTKVQYDGDGSTTSFSVSFNFWEDGDVRAILRDASGTETTWVKGTQYTLTGGSATGSTGTLTVKTSPTDYTPQSGETLTIMSVHAVTQETSFPLGGPFPSTSAETQNDKLARLIQQTQEIIKRAVKFKETTTSANENLELGEPVALAIPRWNSAKTKLESTLVEDLNIGLGTAFRYGFDSSTTMGDPGTGDFRFNNASPSSATAIAFSNKSDQKNNPDISDFIASWDDVPNPTKAIIYIYKNGDPSIFAIYSVTGAVADNTSWLQVTVTNLDNGGTFVADDDCVVTFSIAGAYGYSGLRMKWDSDTGDSDSGAGKIWFNNGTLGSVSTVYVDDVDADSVNINSFVDTWDDQSGGITGTILVRNVKDTAIYAEYDVTGAVTSASTYSKVAVAHVVSAGTFVDGDVVDVRFLRAGDDGKGGPPGIEGPFGYSGIKMKFDTDTSDADSGAGKIYFNNGTYSSATVVYVDDVDADGVNINTFVDSWDDGSGPISGTILVRHIDDTAVYAEFDVTGAVTSASTYSKVAVAHTVSAGTFADGQLVDVRFIRSGLVGSGGPQGPRGVYGHSGVKMLWDSDTSDADSGAGKIYFNNGTLSSVTVVYVDDVDNDGVNINTFVDSWDDGSGPISGTILVRDILTPTIYAEYDVTGAVTSASTYSKVAVTHVVSSGTFVDGKTMDVRFVRSGLIGSGGPPGATGPTGGGLANVVDDTSPQLGANLDVQGFGVTSSSSIMHPSLTSTGKALVLGF